MNSTASPFASPTELTRRMSEEPRPIIFDVRWSMQGPAPDDYAEGHIPGAIFINLDELLAAPAGPGGRHPLPDLDTLREVLTSYGVTPASHVVVYDDCGGLAAGRAWWCLRWAGVGSVSILDGGWGTWRDHDGDVSTDEATPRTLHTEVEWPEAPGLEAFDAPDMTRDDVLAIDVRTPERFRGESEPIDSVAGRIPGAVNVPISEVYDDGAVRSSEHIRKIIHDATAGVSDETHLVAYCGSGVTAAQFAAAAAHAGIDVDIYPGSWSHWITDSTREVATG